MALPRINAWLQVALFAGALLLLGLVRTSVVSLGALTLLGLVAVGSSVLPVKMRSAGPRLASRLAWSLSGVTIAAAIVLTEPFTLDAYHGVAAGLIAAALFCEWTEQRRAPGDDGSVEPGPRFRALALIWAGLAAVLWTAGAYLRDSAPGYYLGLLLMLAVILAAKFYGRPSSWAVQFLNTGLLLVAGLPVVDLFYGASRASMPQPERMTEFYSYDAARRNPEAFSRWWRYYLDQWDLMGKDVFRPDPHGVSPVSLKPGARGRLVGSEIVVNQLGFRGREITLEKGRAYRIVAIGESTTFGCTLRPEDRPWPELLEDMIRERLKPAVPVEVVNAGVPACTLRENLARLPLDILPLKPDLIISYHGVNGFRMLDRALPSLADRHPPVYQHRPSKLLADCEYRWKVLVHRKRQNPGILRRGAEEGDLLASDYARAYADLIELARTNQLRLALANFSMSVNARSDPGPIEFYGSMFPAVRWMIRANAAHSRLVEELVGRNPGVTGIDSRPQLDGCHELFIDLVHLTQPGRERLAENMFAGIREVLERELALLPEGSAGTNTSK